MERSMIVMVADPEDPKRGEITIVDDPVGAARMAEALLEAGVAQERVRVFSASEVKMSVAHRPVVTLFGGDGSATGDKGNSESGEAAPDAQASAEGVEEAPAEGEESEPFVQNGVRFSSLFRSS